MLWPRAGRRFWDAGSGPGRVGKQLHALGHRVTGVDIDPELIDEARRVCPEATWVTADLVDLPQALGFESDAGEDGFELIVCAGNVDWVFLRVQPVSRCWRISGRCWHRVGVP